MLQALKMKGIIMKKSILRLLSLTISIIMIFSCVACGAKVEYESYYEDVPTGNSDNTSNNTSANTSDDTSVNTSVDSGEIEDNSTTSKPTSSVNEGGPTGKTNLSVDEFIAAMPSKLRGTTIKMLFWDDLRSTAYSSALNEFQKATGIKIEIEIANKDAYQTTLASRISSGQSPDVVKCIDNNVSSVANLLPITDSGYDFGDANWDKNLMKMFTFNGKCYAFNVQDSHNKNFGIITYNKKALKRANMVKDDPYTIWKNDPSKWTWNKFWSMCDAFVKANNGKEGYYGSTWGTEDMYVNAFGVALWRYDHNSGKVVNCSNTAESVKRYGEIIKAVNNKWSTTVYDGTGFSSGKILFNATYSSIAENNSSICLELKKGDNLGFVPMPVDSTYTPLFETCAYGIPVGSKNAAAVPYFIRYIFSPESIKESEFYFNEEARAVVSSVIKKDKLFFGNGYNYNVWQEMIKGTDANVKSVLDSYQGMINDNVADANNSISKLH